ncbi:MAG: hypothetical protein Q9217_003866 [Psora testacea]
MNLSTIHVVVVFLIHQRFGLCMPTTSQAPQSSPSSTTTLLSLSRSIPICTNEITWRPLDERFPDCTGALCEMFWRLVVPNGEKEFIFLDMGSTSWSFMHKQLTPLRFEASTFPFDSRFRHDPDFTNGSDDCVIAIVMRHRFLPDQLPGEPKEAAKSTDIANYRDLFNEANRINTMCAKEKQWPGWLPVGTYEPMRSLRSIDT